MFYVIIQRTEFAYPYMPFQLQNQCFFDIKVLAIEQGDVPMEYPRKIVLGCGSQTVANNQ